MIVSAGHQRHPDAAAEADRVEKLAGREDQSCHRANGSWVVRKRAAKPSILVSPQSAARVPFALRRSISFDARPSSDRVQRSHGLRPQVFADRTPGRRSFPRRRYSNHRGLLCGSNFRVKRHLSETHFAWIGAFDDTSPFYYRIQSPVFLVEFDHPHGILQANRKRGVARRDGKTCKSWHGGCQSNCTHSGNPA